jgi:hypothetical protein
VREFHFGEIDFQKYVTYFYLSKFLLKFSEIHSLNFHLAPPQGAKWKFSEFHFIIFALRRVVPLAHFFHYIVSGNILLDFDYDYPVVTMGRICLGITITFAIPLQVIPARDTLLTKRNTQLR